MKKLSNPQNLNFRKVLALVLSVMMLSSLFVAMPAVAEGEEKALSKLEIIRNATNLYGTDNGFENGIIDETWYNARAGFADAGTMEITTQQAYSGTYSALHKFNTNRDYWYKQVPGCSAGKTYIASVMVLGTEANNGNWNYASGAYAERFQFTHVNSSTATLLRNVELWPTIADMVTAPASDAEIQTKVEKSDWMEAVTLFEATGDKVYLGVAPYRNNIEFYSDNYYCGELMVADVVNTTENTSVTIPSTGESTLELSAKALNQLGSEVGLSETTYTWTIKNADETGIALDGSTLKVSPAARPQTVTLTVTANPTFTGADEQEDGIKAYRSKDIEIEVAKLSETQQLENYRNANNLLADFNYSVESEDVSAWSKYYNTNSTLKMTRSSNQAYKGDYSALIEQEQNGDFMAFSYGRALTVNKTYIASAMILGTAGNTELVNNDPYPTNEQYRNNFHLSMGALQNGTKPTWGNNYGTSEKNWVAVSSMLEAPAADSETQVKLGKDKWQMVDNIITINDAVPWNARIGVTMNTNGAYHAEVYTDDYYFGELVVANVRNTTEVEKVEIPKSGTETVTLSAEAVNQLGNSKYLGDVTYAWEFEGETPSGVALEGNTLTISDEAKRGTVAIKVTATPTFTGADTQTDTQKALRTSVIYIDLTEETNLSFETSDTQIIPVAYINNTTSETIDAKVYCAVYEKIDGVLKLENVVTGALCVSAGKAKDVKLPAITEPSYDYEIRSFMWSADGNLVPVIPSAVYSK